MDLIIIKLHISSEFDAQFYSECKIVDIVPPKLINHFHINLFFFHTNIKFMFNLQTVVLWSITFLLCYKYVLFYYIYKLYQSTFTSLIVTFFFTFVFSHHHLLIISLSNVSLTTSFEKTFYIFFSWMRLFSYCDPVLPWEYFHD